ncbi:MAG: hypothetical protein AAAB35_15620 [Phyllobacterium sp.]|uniref:hypothetical protein n=1 Tax=Phyllobacterium sp. TaxID=1871046 RepID=UPI0030F2B6E3
MGQKIDQFTESLRLKLTASSDNLDSLKAKIDGKVDDAEADVRARLDEVKGRIEQGKASVSAANSRIKNWIEAKKAATDEQISAWKTELEIDRLEDRAALAEEYALAAREVAAAAIDDAEEASLEAWLARRDADAAAGK